MSRKVKFFVVLAMLAVIGATTVSAQSGAGNADAKLFNIDLGMVSGYSLLNENAIVGKTFSFNITLADNFALGIASFEASNTYTLLRAAYYLTPAIGFDLYVGASSAGPGVGTGACVFYNVLKSKPDNAFATALKVKLGYLFNTTDEIDNGDIIIAVSTSIGY
jgi:hypothetical protein